jgi:hypothetical protein
VSAAEAPKYVQVTDELIAESVTGEAAQQLIAAATAALRKVVNAD